VRAIALNIFLRRVSNFSRFQCVVAEGTTTDEAWWSEWWISDGLSINFCRTPKAGKIIQFHDAPDSTALPIHAASWQLPNFFD